MLDYRKRNSSRLHSGTAQGQENVEFLRTRPSRGREASVMAGSTMAFRPRLIGRVLLHSFL